MNNIMVKDVAEVFVKNLADPSQLYFFGITSQVDWTSKITTTLLRGGIGNFVQGVLATDKEMDFTVTPLYYSDELIAMLMGTASSDGTATVKASEKGLTVQQGKVTITGTPVTGTTSVDVFDNLGNHYTGTYSETDKSVTITGTPAPADGTIVSVVYPQSVTGSIIELTADKFPTNYEIWAHTIAYNPDTNAVAEDIYIHLYKAMPDGNLNAQFKGGSNINMPIKFLAQTKLGTTNYGEYIAVPRN